MLTNAPRSNIQTVENLNITIFSAPQRVYLLIVRIDDIDDLRIVKDVHILSEVTSDVNELIKSSTPALDEIYVHEESISDVQDALVESSTPSHNIRCSLSIPMIEEEIKHEIIVTSVDTSEF